MKRIIFLAAVLLVIFSGVAGVSAYEGHVIDVKAHVENALWVKGEAIQSDGSVETNLNLGTLFPQQSVETDVVFGLSNSFLAQNAYSTVQFNLYWESKPASGNVTFKDIWPYMKVSLNGVSVANPASGAYPILITSGALSNPNPSNGDIHFTFMAPVFDKWYNPLTDPIASPKIINYNSGSGYNIVNETVTCSQYAFTGTVIVPNVDLGNNLKIQVISIVPHVTPQ